jgi:hypothetical protein
MSGAGLRALLATLALSLLAGCASDGPRSAGNRLLLGGPGVERDQFNRADPSKVIAAELAFARAAQEKGQWTAFADYSTDEAVMFVPEAVNAHDWLKGRADPPQAVRWQPHQVWSSCDGSLAVTKGAWQRPNGTVGYFTTVWERQRGGEYKWVLDQGNTLAEPLAAPELIAAKVAQCERSDGPQPRRERFGSATIRPTLCEGGRCNGDGASADGTFTYAYAVTAQGRRLTVQMRENGAMLEVLRSEVSAE